MALIGIVLAFVLNVVALQYAMGAIQSAVDEGARAGSALGGTVGSCERVAHATLRGRGGLLTGSLGRGIAVKCSVSGDVITASATGTLRWLFEAIPAQSVRIVSHAVVERPP